ncbi:MAG: hypothetical protein ABGX47_23710 [Martelella sp.]
MRARLTGDCVFVFPVTASIAIVNSAIVEHQNVSGDQRNRSETTAI